MVEDDYGRLPAYWRVEKHLSKLIRNLKPGDILPSEKELMNTYRLSRTTIRTALNDLVVKGAIVRKPGKGTFVAEPTIIESLAFLNSFSSEMREKNKASHSKVLSLQIEPPDENVRDIFGISPGVNVMKLERIRFMGDTPIAFQRSFINISLDGKLERLLEMDFNRNSLYATLEAMDLTPDSAEEEIRVTVLDSRMSGLLKCCEGSYGLSRSRKTYLSDNRCIEFVDSVYRGDNYTLKLFLRRRSSLCKRGTVVNGQGSCDRY